MDNTPKSLKHWFEQSGFRMTYIYRKWRQYPMGYSKKLDRHIRVLPHLNVMQICDGNFDRWANSVGGEIAMPTTHQEFKNALRILLETTNEQA